MATPAPAPTQAQPAKRKRAGVDSAGLKHYSAAREAALQAFRRTHRVQALWRALTRATDDLLAHAALPDGAALIAVGGYGRRELFPFSDVDVLILVPDNAGAQGEAQVIALLQSLWDQQIPVSHATRSARETVTLAVRDATICTALMDARLIAGDRPAFLKLKRTLKREVFGSNPRQFVEAKLAERDTRHARYGDSRFMLEPNIKEGKGGLRDLQTLTWLARYCYGIAKAGELVRDDLLQPAEWNHFRHAYVFFSTVRACLHIARGRADERLSFDLQTQIAAELGFRGKTSNQRAERLMLRYFQFAREVGALTRMVCALLEEQNMRARPAPFVTEGVAKELPDYLGIENGRLNFTENADPMQAPHQALDLFALAQVHDIDIHPRAQLMLSRLLPRMGRHLPLDGESNRLFLTMLLSPKAPEITLRRMNETGVLAAIIPEFRRITGQMQYDGYHTYTVDEHTLVAVANLAAIESGVWERELPLATQLARDISDRAVLYIAMLCHDIAKGAGGGHADKGASMTMRIANRLGLNNERAELVGWLVQHHLLLSDTAFKRDLDDPQTIADFVNVVQSPERLRLLLLITAADIKAVGPTIWNGWKGSLMRTLYQRAMAAMGVGLTPVQNDALPEGLIARWKAKPNMPAIDIRHDTFRAVTEITCCMHYAPRLFAALAGVMAWVGGSIVSARMRQLTPEEAEGAVLAQWQIQNLRGESFAEDGARLKKLPQLILQALDGSLPLAEGLPKRRVVAKKPSVSIRSGVFIDNQVSAAASVIEVNARDRIGLLHAMLRALDDCQLQVMTAHIATYGQLAVDVFYVKDAYGHKLTHYARQAQVQQALLDAVRDPGEGA